MSSCYSEIQADEISKFIPYVIGINNEINQDACMYFAKSFYSSIANDENIELAFNLARNQIKLLDGFDSEKDRPLQEG